MDTEHKIFGTWVHKFHEWGLLQDFLDMVDDLDIKYEDKTIYPSKANIFKAFRETRLDQIKVVMLFQDPYHDGSATGLATANEPVNKEDPISPTLRIMMEEWQNSVKTSEEFDTSLIPWARQGVLLLNCALTVEEGAPKSHIQFWRPWMEKFITSLSMDKHDILFVLFGKESHKWKDNIINGGILYCTHPAAELYSSGNSGFLGSKIYARINEVLGRVKKSEIIW